MEKRTQAYHEAVEVAIEEAELGELPESDDWPAWADRVSFTVSDEREASELFNTDPVEVFEAWASDLPDRDLQEVTKALGTLRQAIVRYHAEKAEHDPVVTMAEVLADLG